MSSSTRHRRAIAACQHAATSDAPTSDVATHSAVISDVATSDVATSDVATSDVATSDVERGAIGGAPLAGRTRAVAAKLAVPRFVACLGVAALLASGAGVPGVPGTWGVARAQGGAGAQGGAQADGDLAFEDYDEALEFAENAFAFGDYARTIAVLGRWLLPAPPVGARSTQVIDGLTWLGVAAWFEADLDLAEQAFLLLLRRVPSHELDPFVFPPQVIRFFRDVRAEHRDSLATPGEDATGGTVYIESRVRETSIWVSMLPFGYGMFANGESEWGIAYAFTQVTLLTTSATLFWANYADRLPSDDPNVPFGYPDPDRARTRKRAHIATGAAFLAVMAANMVHGALIHRRGADVQYRTLDAPPEGLRDATSEAPQDRDSRAQWNVRLYPILELTPRHPGLVPVRDDDPFMPR